MSTLREKLWSQTDMILGTLRSTTVCPANRAGSSSQEAYHRIWIPLASKEWGHGIGIAGQEYWSWRCNLSRHVSAGPFGLDIGNPTKIDYFQHAKYLTRLATFHYLIGKSNLSGYFELLCLSLSIMSLFIERRRLEIESSVVIGCSHLFALRSFWTLPISSSPLLFRSIWVSLSICVPICILHFLYTNLISPLNQCPQLFHNLLLSLTTSHSQVSSLLENG